MVVKLVSFREICRACMQYSPNLRPLHDRPKLNHKAKFALMLTKCASIQITDNDGLPDSLCSKCAHLLTSLYRFRLKLRKVHRHLTRLKKNGVTTIEIDDCVTKVENGDDIFDNHDANQGFMDKVDVDTVLKAELIVKAEDKWDVENGPFEYENTNFDELTKLNGESGVTKSKINKNLVKKADDDEFLSKNDRASRVKLKSSANKGRDKLGKSKFLETKMTKKRDESASGMQQCKMCGKFLSNKTNMTVHLRKHTGERPFTCEICHRSFSRHEHLNRHVLIHYGKKPYSCEVCEKSFVQRESLKVHMRTHTGERPHMCSLCGKSFRQAVTVNRHMRTHTGERPYSCTVCQKSFTHSGNLNVHMRYHNNERPYNCKRCNKSFVTLSHLGVHLKQHDGIKDHECHLCMKRFTHRQHLKDHLVVHSGEKPHRCEFCPKKYTQKTHLNQHMRASHNVQRVVLATDEAKMNGDIPVPVGF